MPPHNIFTLPNGSSFRMVPVPGTGDGFFTMGSPEDEPGHFDGESQHPVCLSDFQLGEFPVTQALWTAVLGENPSHFKGDQRPVEKVSWFDAAVFCNALNKMLGKKPCYFLEADTLLGLGEKKRSEFGWDEGQKGRHLPNAGNVICVFQPGSFRLATEAEWEYAARGGPFAPALQKPLERDYHYAGSDQLEQVGWFDKNSDGQTRDVGLLLPNALGLYDMCGNIWEWCNDWYEAYPKTKTLERDPKGPAKAKFRILRGGGWNLAPRLCRPACRGSYGPDGRDISIGFRLALQ